MKDAGFTLIEVLVALTIMGIISVAMAPSFISHARMNTMSEKKTEAIQAAQMILDGTRIQDMSSLPTSGSATAVSVDIGDRVYEVVVKYCEASQYCPPTVSNNTRHITAEVFLDGDEIYELQTVFTKLQ